MASSTSTLWASVSRSCSFARSRAVSTSFPVVQTSKASGSTFAAHAQVFRRSFVLSALDRSVLPRRLFPCDMLLARNASSAAAAARIPSAIYEDNGDATAQQSPKNAKTKDDKDPATHFSTMEERLHPDTLKAITKRPFKHTHMSVVQARIFPLLPHLAEAHDAAAADNTADRPRDLLVKAKTGTGKTMAFLVPAIESRLKSIDAYVAQAKINLGEKWSKAEAFRTKHNFAIANVGTLIISPTRELATQIAVEAQNLSTHHVGFNVQILLGGESKSKQIREWNRARKDIIVATPGRLMDLLDSQPEFSEALKSTRLLVLDEADTLLDMGFREDIETISKHLPRSPVRQTFLFSATVSRAIQDIASKLLDRRHTFVNCVSDTDTATHTHIPQYTTTLQSGADALPHLIKLIVHDQLLCHKEGRKSKIIVFFSTTKMTQLFADMLKEAANSRAVFPFDRNTKTYEMHAKRDMDRRISVSGAFRNDVSPSTASILITSDVSARGVDYPGVTRVIQMGVPASVEMYVHRLGRTGRGGDRGGKGRGDIVLSDWEAPWLPRLERDTGGKVQNVTTDALSLECKKLIDELTPGSGISYGHANFAEIDTFSADLTRRLGSPEYDAHESPYPGAVASDLIATSFSSSLGFYVGRASMLGLRMDLIQHGLQTYFQTMCGHDRTMNVPKKMLEMSGGGGGSDGYRRRGSSFGHTGTGSRDRYSGYASSSGGGGASRGGYGGSSYGGDASARRGSSGGYSGSSGSRYGASSFSSSGYSSGRGGGSYGGRGSSTSREEGYSSSSRSGGRSFDNSGRGRTNTRSGGSRSSGNDW